MASAGAVGSSTTPSGAFSGCELAGTQAEGHQLIGFRGPEGIRAEPALQRGDCRLDGTKVALAAGQPDVAAVLFQGRPKDDVGKQPFIGQPEQVPGGPH